jgi:hypothetical protein
VSCDTLITQVQSFVVAIVIVALSLTLLGPRIAHPTKPTLILNETVFLTEDDYERQYNLTLNKGDQLKIQVTGNGQLVNLKVIEQSSPSHPLLDEEAQTFYSFEWTVLEDGSYIFTLSADTGAQAAITITKT